MPIHIICHLPDPLLPHWSLPFTIFFLASWHPACIYEDSLAELAPQHCTLRSVGHHWDPSCEPGGGGAGPGATPPSRLVLVTSPSVSEWRPLLGLVRRCPRPGSPYWSASYRNELWIVDPDPNRGMRVADPDPEARKLSNWLINLTCCLSKRLLHLRKYRVCFLTCYLL
jgi:hypothetical protein